MTDLKNHIQDKAHVIWDWNGTLLADIDHAVTVVNVLLQEEGLGATTVDHYKKVFGFPVVDYYKRLGFDCRPANFARLCERFNQLFHDGLTGCDLWPGAREVLAEVKNLGKLQSVLSASEQNMLNYSVKLFKVEHYFDHVQGIADKLAGSKIDFGHKLMKRAGVPKEHCVLIGDTDHDLEVAEALGIDMILVEHGHQCPTRLRDIHHTVVKVL
jgi:phosphoglycolate phosphatase